jgi:hypothetical protein
MGRCIEGGTTGAREAAVMLLVGPDQFYVPNPYAPDLDLRTLGALPNHVADHPKYDTNFPAHPLYRLRALLERVQASTRIDDPALRALRPFTGLPT